MEGGGSRGFERKRVLLNATILSERGWHTARISDLSASGVRVSCANPPNANCDVIFKKGSTFVAARVIWADKTGAGLQFYRELGPEDLLPSARLHQPRLE